MILTGQKIEQAVREGTVTIDPFDPARVNPNSYNYRLGPRLRVHTAEVIDSYSEHAVDEFTIPVDGAELEPGQVYLGTTVETIGSQHYVPSLIGRSSLGRLGIYLQVSADLGNLGAVHRWTLEIVVCQRIRLYPEMVVGQVSFWAPTGDRSVHYGGYFGRFSHAQLPYPDLLVRGHGSTDSSRP